MMSLSSLQLNHILCASYVTLIFVQINRESLLFVIPAFGGIVSWKGEGAPFEEDDNSITHQVCCDTLKTWSLTCYE